MNKKIIYEKNINNYDFNRLIELSNPHVSLVDGDIYDEEYFFRDQEMFRPQLDDKNTH